jgi:hypothetical protein
LSDRLANVPNSDKLYSPDEDFYPYNDKPGTTSIGEQVLKAWRQQNSDGANVVLPIGSEKIVAQQLVDEKVITHAGYLRGECGGGEVSFFVVPKRISLGNLVEGLAFERFLRDGLKIYAQENKVENSIYFGTVSIGKLYVSPIEPHYPKKRFTLVVPSEVSRGNDNGGVWDKFDIVFSLYRSTKNAFVIELHSENLRHAPRRTEKPPSKEHFKSREEGDPDYEAEYIVAASVARHFGEKPENCLVEAEGFWSKDQGPFRCVATY